MNPDFEKRLEAQIERELKALPELPAPHSLVLRVMRAIESRAHAAWYRQAWQMWPMPLRAVSLVLLLAAFGGLCFAGWHASHLALVTTAFHKVGAWLAEVGALRNALSAVAGSVFVAAKHLGTGFLIGCLVAVGLGYAMCVGLGTVYVRLGFASGRNRL